MLRGHWVFGRVCVVTEYGRGLQERCGTSGRLFFWLLANMG
jgi:hypothetical protein